MVQTDIIYYGTDLADYIQQEFGRAGYDIDPHWAPPTAVPFWRDFL
jgi:hypothetical protein